MGFKYIFFVKGIDSIFQLIIKFYVTIIIIFFIDYFTCISNHIISTHKGTKTLHWLEPEPYYFEISYVHVYDIVRLIDDFL